MPDTLSAHFNFIKPEVGASAATWGTKWNTNADSLDSLLYTLTTGKQDSLVYATVSDVWSATPGLIAQLDEQYTSAVPVAATWTGATTVDFNTFANLDITLTGNVTLGATTHAKPGTSGVIELTHSGAARTITLNPTYWVANGGGGIALSVSGGGAHDVIGYYVQANGKVLLGVSALGVA